MYKGKVIYLLLLILQVAKMKVKCKNYQTPNPLLPAPPQAGSCVAL